MRRANKPPSEWLKLLCKDWASENEVLVETTDAKFLDYKPYLKGLLTSQLLCRLSLPQQKDAAMDGSSSSQSTVDFWRILGIEDEFDKSYIVAQIERFCSLYNIRGPTMEEDDMFGGELPTADSATLAAAAAAGLSVSPNGGLVSLPSYMDQSAATAAAAAAAAATHDMSKLSKKQVSEVSKAHRMAKDAEKALEHERRQNMKREQRRVSVERKEQKTRDREQMAVSKAAERASRESTREERRRKKLEIRLQREKFSQEQKEAALKRAAELVSSNRVPIEITRGAAAAKAAATAAYSTIGAAPSELEEVDLPNKKARSAIVVSTAADLHQIVTHSKNLWAKYNAIAKEHNQKVNWITVAKELGIHVKVREKYARYVLQLLGLSLKTYRLRNCLSYTLVSLYSVPKVCISVRNKEALIG
jgi:chemotaxis protein histidine kinase CheA